MHIPIRWHRWLAIIGINLLIFAILLVIGEVISRQFVTYSLNYYEQVGNREPGVYIMPYGEIRSNSLGYADDEFDLASTKPRIGYVGDSVNAGVGAGYGNRVSELLATAYPTFEHWNVGAGVGTGIQQQRMIVKAAELRLDTVVYLLNLNDLAQASNSGDRHDRTWVAMMQRVAGNSLDYFRDKSYLYNSIRLSIKNVLFRAGYDHRGRRAVELWPGEHGEEIKTMCNVLNDAKAELQAQGSDLCVILLPYEMQISKQAAEIYRKLGFTWDASFEDGATQEALQACIAFTSVYDPRPVFDRETSGIGEYFVYNRGDAIDWNHPTAAGHRRIAAGFIASRSCPILDAVESGAIRDLDDR